MDGLRYQRVLLKLSGEVLAGEQGFGLSPPVVDRVAGRVAEISRLGAQVGIVIGGGNFFRGMKAVELGLDRVNADTMGMLATVINGLALQDALERIGIPTRVLTPLHITQVAEPYVRRRAIRHLEKGRVIILAAGTGNPFFSTDTAAALRAVEIGAEVILKATKVDGVYTADPATDPAAEFLKRVSHREVLNRGLRVMDATAVSLCMENDLPIIVFKMQEEDSLKRVLLGEDVGTLVGGKAQ